MKRPSSDTVRERLGAGLALVRGRGFNFGDILFLLLLQSFGFWEGFHVKVKKRGLFVGGDKKREEGLDKGAKFDFGI